MDKYDIKNVYEVYLNSDSQHHYYLITSFYISMHHFSDVPLFFFAIRPNLISELIFKCIHSDCHPFSYVTHTKKKDELDLNKTKKVFSLLFIFLNEGGRLRSKCVNKYLSQFPFWSNTKCILFESALDFSWKL